jgi:XTP/dITP diphosphohydrolase
MQEKAKAFLRLLDIMDDLRNQCPWDMKQTKESLRLLTIEETYELSDAILKNDLQAVQEELGDLMLHLVFYSKIGEEEKAFDVADVLHSVCDKLIRRHPHIYGDVTVDGEDDVKANWEEIQLGVQEDIEDEYGDVLFALVNYSRYLKIDPEAALEKSNRKFKHRFQYIEEQAQYQGKDLKDMTLAEMDALWNEAKKKAVKTDRL